MKTFAARWTSGRGPSMAGWLLAVFMVVAAACAGASDGPKAGPATVPCSDAWYRSVEEQVRTGDGQGHGPDIGSEEWKTVIELKLGILGKADLPGHQSEAWCSYVDRITGVSRALSEQGRSDGGAAQMRGPSFPCDNVAAGSIAALVCGDRELSALDRTLSGVYAAASEKADDQQLPLFKTEQRGWIKGRDDCWKSDDRRGCVRGEYRLRIAELQARFRLVSGTGPVRYICDDSSEVMVTFFPTDPPTLEAERGGSVSLMRLQPSGSGAKYQGRLETFWEHQGEASITWGYGAPEMRCWKAP